MVKLQAPSAMGVWPARGWRKRQVDERAGEGGQVDVLAGLGKGGRGKVGEVEVGGAAVGGGVDPHGGVGGEPVLGPGGVEVQAAAAEGGAAGEGEGEAEEEEAGVLSRRQGIPDAPGLQGDVRELHVGRVV